MAKAPLATFGLIPPMGSGLGLPFTVWLNDNPADPTTGNENTYNRDYTLWSDKFEPSDGNVQPVANVLPNAPEIQTRQNTGSIQPTTSTLGQLSTAPYAGMTLNLSEPRLSFGTSQLEFGQIGAHGTRSLWDATEATDCWILPRRSYAGIGRYTSHKRDRFASSRAGNYTVPGGTSMEPTSVQNRVACDTLYGNIGAIDSIGACSNANWNGGARVAAKTHYVATDLPSNGFGISYGDAHNSLMLTSLHSFPLRATATASTLGIDHDRFADSGNFSGDEFHTSWDSMWGVNLRTIPQTLASGTTLSSADRNPTSVDINSEDDPRLSDVNTIQLLAVEDKVGSTKVTDTIGPTHLGNHVVADSAGLIGYEGTITATAFFSVSKQTMASQSDKPIGTAGNTYAGINIQVHSGFGHRRNRLRVNQDTGTNYETVFKYGTDGAAVAPMTDAIGTRAKRFSDSTTNGNFTGFFASRSTFDTNGSHNDGTAQDNLRTGFCSITDGILGDTVGHNAVWSGTSTLSSAFMKDRIPTRVRIVPQIVGYKEVTVAPGTLKANEYAGSANMTFRKPIVDYHVLVSLASPSGDIIKRDATRSGKKKDVGTATTRNNPHTGIDYGHIDADYSGEAVNIFHGIFRINPDTLEQIYVDSAGSPAHDYGGGVAELQCPTSIIPRHYYDQSGKPNQGWGLHQVTPFRPLANTSWSKVPLLCGAIESGGFYQRGGISHLWDASAWGTQLVVGADVVDTSNLNAEVWGSGQFWPDGSNTPKVPPGQELLLFCYDRQDDPWHPGKKDTTRTDNPLRDAMLAATTTDHITGTYATSMDSGFTITDKRLLSGLGWKVHDWVFPQRELMRYLGVEQKSQPKFNQNGHPTLHCSSLRIMEDGKMMMAAIQRDHIATALDYPLFDVGYPPNPDLEYITTEDGYYYDSDNRIVRNIAGVDETPGSSTLDPFTGESLTKPVPRPAMGDRDAVPPGTNFMRWPTWSKLIASSSGRSLVLMFNNTPATTSKLPTGKTAKFSVRSMEIGTQTVEAEEWTFDDTWWSGSRISWWFPESGQRAIPITYGSYPENRCSHATLPKSLPHLMSDLTHDGGYPLQIPYGRIADNPNTGAASSRVSLDPWVADDINFFRLTRFIPTTIGFADFASGPSPHQELGYAGWCWPTGLFDPIPYTDSNFFTEGGPNSIFQNLFPLKETGLSANKVLCGPGGGFSHYGPLHYGLSEMFHPYKTDRVWTQVHGGVGYDLPLHLLIPPAVHVRAKSGGSSSLDLEMELPFHRTDTLDSKGASLFNAGFDLGPEELPGQTRPLLGNYTLDTRLFAGPISNSGTSLTGGYDSDFMRVHGPTISGTGLSAFWADHPTDRFHAAAMPIMPDNTYDHGNVESNNYPPILLSRTSEYNRLDALALGEQLLSSTEVSIPQGSRPFWDSGSIVSGRGVGRSNGTPGDVTRRALSLSEMSGDNVNTVNDAIAVPTVGAKPETDVGLGKGQRVLRTPDGTLHNFVIERSVVSANFATVPPAWIHYKKPIDSDLFWNSKAVKDDTSSTYDGKDEVGPNLESLCGTNNLGRLLGASFASDSQGTIHAVVEVMVNQSDTSTYSERAHRLYYTYAKRTVVASSPSPVYDWDWSAHTPQLINTGAATGTNGEAAGSANDLRLPSLACDGSDRLHLAFQQVFKAEVGGGNLPTYSAIWFMNKLADEDEFPTWTLDTSPTAPATSDERIQLVSSIMTVAERSDATVNQASSSSHKVELCDHPKVLLRGDNIPIVSYRARNPNFTTSARTRAAIYLNRGKEGTGPNLPTQGVGALGRIKFVTDDAIHALGYAPTDDKNTTPLTSILHYDAIIDEYNQMFTIGSFATGGSYKDTVFVQMWDTMGEIDAQYSAGRGLGITRTLFAQNNANKRTNIANVTATTNGEGQIHIVMGFTLTGNAIVTGNTDRDTESRIEPMQSPATPVSPLDAATGGDGTAYSGGYDEPTSSNRGWNYGGTYMISELSDWDDKNHHLLEVWMPSFEWSQGASDDNWVIRSVNMRWLSVPSMQYDASEGWTPSGEAQGITGSEQFPHEGPQLRYQRFHGFNAGSLDLTWLTNEQAWRTGPLPQTRLYLPGGGLFYSAPAILGDASGDQSVTDLVPGYSP